ncbi:MAG: class I tRNA ligase family protein, partial [Candidatus Diapherotrites archaeon]|nr:class I tRNA ligase family protein [Candidatus Diapherotrites archaeon]
EKLHEAKQEVYSTGFFKGTMLSIAGKYAGMKVQEAKEKVKEDLINSGKADLFFDFSEEVICRCGAKVVIKKIPDQWFINYSNEALTVKSKNHAEKMNILPKEFYNNMPGVLEWFQDRACARLGNWLGTKLPFDNRWTIEPISDSTLYPCYYIVSKFINLNKIKAEQLTEEFFDFVFLEKGTVQAVSKNTGITVSLLEEIQGEAKHFLPLDINLGGKEHQTVHFPVFLMNHVAVMPEKYWPKGIFVNWWVIGKGSKISKSKGGAEPIPDAIKEYSVDAMRLYYANIGSSFVDIVWDNEKAKTYRKTLERIYSLVQELTELKEKNSNPINDWIKSKINLTITDSTNALNEFDFRSASEKIYFSIPTDLKWFLKRGGNDKKTIEFVLERWIKLMALVTPHLAEELWELIGKKEFVSISEWPKEEKISIEAMESEKLIESVLEDIKNISELAKITKLNGVRIFTCPEWKWKVIQKVSNELTAPDFGAAMKIASQLNEAKAHAKMLPKFIQSILKKLPDFKGKKPLNEFTALMDANEFLEKELNTSVIILKAEEAQAEETVKAGNASPLKPAILLK